MARNTSKHSQATINHDEIRAWAEERGGGPAVVRSTHTDKDSGILRIDFGEPEANLEAISWEEFFAIFDERGLAFLYQDETSGGERSFFFKLVARDNTPPDTSAQEEKKKKKDGAEGGADDDEEEDDEDDEDEEEEGKEHDEDDSQG